MNGKQLYFAYKNKDKTGCTFKAGTVTIGKMANGLLINVDAYRQNCCLVL